MIIMENTGFSSPRTDAFPVGLRVLVVDDDPTWLKILEKMLKKCSYEVTTCGLAREALDLLRERKDGFDIVISDVNMPDMDGFKLLEHVGLEMDLPVIMMSVDGETSRVMKGVQHGACDYLLKPIRMKELRNIWQHVFRKRIHEVRDIEFHEGIDEIHMMRNGSDQSESRHFPSGTDSVSGKKRKDIDNKHDDRECNDPSSVKKSRVVWTVDLHQKFVKAVNHFGFDKVGPKKILDLMGVPWLTRENVASHLQKYRLYLGRLQKEKELTASFGGMKYSDIATKEPNGNHCLQNLVNKQQCDLTSGNYSIHGNKTVMQNIEPEMKPAYVNSRSLGIGQLSPVGCKVDDLCSVQPGSKLTNGEGFKSISSAMWSMNSRGFDHILEGGVESAERSLNLASGTAITSWDENVHGGFLQGDFQLVNVDPESIESLNYSNPELTAEVPTLVYDSLKFDLEYPFDSTEYTVIDQGLFIV